MNRRAFFPRALVGVGGPLAQGMDAPVDVGVFGGVVVDQRVNYRLGFLAGGRIVQIDQGSAVDRLLQDGKIIPNLGYVKREGLGGHFRRLPAGFCRR